MIARIDGTNVECRAAKKEADRITLFLGKYDEFKNEITSVFVGFDPDKVVLNGGDWEEDDTPPSQLDQIEAQVTYTAMMTDTLLEV